MSGQVRVLDQSFSLVWLWHGRWKAVIIIIMLFILIRDLYRVVLSFIALSWTHNKRCLHVALSVWSLEIMHHPIQINHRLLLLLFFFYLLKIFIYKVEHYIYRLNTKSVNLYNLKQIFMDYNKVINMSYKYGLQSMNKQKRQYVAPLIYSLFYVMVKFSLF